MKISRRGIFRALCAAPLAAMGLVKLAPQQMYLKVMDYRIYRRKSLKSEWLIKTSFIIVDVHPGMYQMNVKIPDAPQITVHGNWERKTRVETLGPSA